MMTWHVHIRVVAPPGVKIHDFYVELNPKISISVPAVGLISRRDAAKSEDFDAYRPTFRKNRRLRRRGGGGALSLNKRCLLKKSNG